MDLLISDNNKEIKVSVYCLAYNHEKYITKTLEGFVNQITDFRFEVFVHDDASTDHTADIIREYANKYPSIIKPIFQQENQYSKGTAIFLNFIYPKMQGKYIASCEGDDYWNDPYKLQKQFDALETHLECSLSTHKVQCCNEDGTFNACVIPGNYYHIKNTGVIKEEELAKCYWVRGDYPFHTSSYFYRRSIRDIELIYPRDVGTLRKCLAKGLVYYIDEPMSTRRLGSIGNWNARMRNKGIQGKYDLALQDDAAEDRFDQYTNYRYHEYIGVGRLNKFIQFIQYPAYSSAVRELLNQYNLTPWKVRKTISFYMFLRLQIKYTIAMHFPYCYSIVKKGWRWLARHNEN